MARARNIKPAFFTNDELAEVDPLARLLFIGLWCIADREGRLIDRPKKIKAELLPYDNCDADALLQQLADRKFIIRYAVQAERFIQIVNFTKHQDPHYKEKASDIPSPPDHQDSGKTAGGVSEDVRQAVFKRDGGRCKACDSTDDLSLDHIIPRSKGGSHDESNLQTLCRRCNAAKNNRQAKSDIDQSSANDRPIIGQSSPGQSPLNPDSLNPLPDSGFPPTSSKPAARSDEYTPAFEQAWNDYPTRPGASKKETFKAWNARLKAGVDVGELMAGASRYAAYCKTLKTEPQFIKQPATFFGPDEHYKADWTAPAPQARASPTYQTAQEKQKSIADRLTGNSHANRQTIIDIN